jgi:alkylation response protein AidB-like acyl-CoA dehydrogenase
MIRFESKGMDVTGKISDRLLQFIYDHQLFKLIVPKEVGGKMLDLPSAAKTFQEASYIDGNFGWTVTIGSGGGMFVPNMTEATMVNCYSPSNAVIAGSGFPAGTAKPVENGYVINGKWFYCSGSQFATTFTAACIVENEKEKMLAFAIKPEQVNVLGDWNAFGLRGTSSHSIEVTDQFIPQERVFSVFEHQNDRTGHVQTFPFAMFAEASFASITLGIGKHFLDEVNVLLDANKQNWRNGPIDRYTLLQNKLRKEKERWKRADQKFHTVLNTAWEIHIQSEEVSSELRREFSTIAKRCATTSIHCANSLFRHIGMQAALETNSLNQIWRDLYTAGQHMFLTPHNETESLPF